MTTGGAYSPAAERLLFTLHHMLDAACTGRGKVPIGASAMLQKAIDEMRNAGVTSDEIRRAENVAVSLHRAEWFPVADPAEGAAILARLRDDVRLLLVAPADAGLPEDTTADTLFDWQRPKLSDLFVQPAVWLSRMRRHRMAAA